MPGTSSRDPSSGKFEYHEGGDWWNRLSVDQKEQLIEEVTGRLQREVGFDRLVKTMVDAKLETVWEEKPSNELLDRLFEQADDETIANCIPEEVVEECVEEQMAASSTSSETVKKAQRETLISLFRVVGIVGAAIGGLTFVVFAVAGGYPLAIVSLLMTAFFVYAYQYDFKEI